MYATLETCQGVDEVGRAEDLFVAAIAQRAVADLPAAWHPPPVPSSAVGHRLNAWLSAWAAHVAPTPLVVFLDETDVVRGEPLVSLLRQLRAGFAERPTGFPASVALVGMRDLRDDLTVSKGGVPFNPGSPFNIKAESLTLQNFTAAEVAALYAKHTAATGQAFLPDAVARAFHWSRGQPFLVNKLAATCVEKLVPDRSVPVAAHHVDEAKEALVLSRTTHLDALAQRLREPRVADIVSRVIAGSDDVDHASGDFPYCVDLGLLARSKEGAQPSNPLYREVLARERAYNAQENLRLPRARWLRPDGTLDAAVLVSGFLAWWRENSDFAVRNTPAGYHEATVHLAFMAFLQKVVNGGGQVYREFAAGSGRVDLCVEMAGARTVIELKRVRPDRGTRERAVAEGVAQLREYLDTMGQREGRLLVFDQREGLGWDERTWSEDRVVEGYTLHLRGA